MPFPLICIIKAIIGLLFPPLTVTLRFDTAWDQSCHTFYISKWRMLTESRQIVGSGEVRTAHLTQPMRIAVAERILGFQYRSLPMRRYW